MRLSRKTKIISTIAVLGALTIGIVYFFQGDRVQSQKKVRKEFKTILEQAESFKDVQLDSALHYANAAFQLVKEEPEMELEKNTASLTRSEIKFLKSGASDKLYQEVENCENWFRKRKQYEQAFWANLLRLELKSFLIGTHAVREDLGGLVKTANLSESDRAKAYAHYFRMRKRDFTRKWEDDVHILDSARMFAARINDSILLAKIRITSVLPDNGSQESVDSTHLSLEEAISLRSKELKCFSYETLALEFYPLGKVDSAQYYLNKCSVEAKQWGSLVHKAILTRKMALTHQYTGMPDSVVKYAEQGIELSRKIGDTQMERRILADLGLTLMSKGENSKAIVVIMQSVEIAKRTNAEHGLFTSQQYLVNLLTKAERFNEAKKVIADMLGMLLKKERNHANDMDRASVFYLKGHLANAEGNLDSALIFFQKSAAYMEGLQSTGQKRFQVEASIFKNCLDDKNYEMAEDQYEFMRETFQGSALKSFQFLYMAGELKKELGEDKEAISLLLETLERSHGSIPKLQYLSCFGLSELFERKGDFKKALEYNKRGLKIKKEFDESKDDLKLERLQSQYELSQKETEIQQLDIERLEQKNTLEAKENALQTRRLYIIFLLVLLIPLAVIVLSISRRSKDALARKELQRNSLEKERQIERLKAQESERAIELKNQLFANISHEFRTPLTLINAPVEELLETASNESRKPLEVVKRNADHLLVMVDEILELTKLDEGKTVLSIKPFGLNSFIEKLRLNFAPVLKQKGIVLEVELPEKPYTVTGDEHRLKMVLNNLLKNALHHTSRSGKIILTVEPNQEQERLQLKVFNSGSWIDEEFLPSIFDRYARSKDKEYAGYGIGLSFCKKIVELHNGTISAENIEGGVLLSFSFPTTLEVGEPIVVKEREFSIERKSEQEVGGENTLLVVEDNPEVQGLLKDILSKEYQIIVADNGEEGITKAKEHQPNLIISDIMMPKVEGIELAKTLKENFSTSHIPIILLTAKSTGHDRITGLETGADDYLTKPFSPKELRIRVKNLIEQREKLQKRFSKNVFLKPEEMTSNSLDQEFLTKATQIVEENLQNEEFSVEKFCRLIALNRNSVHQKLKLLTGKSASQFIKSIKLKKAAMLLADERISIVEISELSGFNNRQAFHKAFKEQFELTPSEYRNNIKEVNEV